MKIEYMKEFIKLADSLNITATAEDLFISQSTLSRHIKAMENELGFKLLQTSSHGIQLTAAGEDALKAFTSLLKEYDALLTRNRPTSNAYTGRLRFGILYYLRDDGYIDFIEAFQKKYPGIEVVCMSNYQPHTLYEALIYGKVDIATLFSYQRQISENLRYQVTEDSPSVVMVKDTHPLASRPEIHLSDLTDMTMINLKLDTYSFKQTITMLEQNHFQAKNVVDADNIETVPSKIRHTNGFHITREKCRKQQAKGIAYIPLADKNTRFYFGVMAINRKDPLINLFFEEIRRYFANCQR